MHMEESYFSLKKCVQITQLNKKKPKNKMIDTNLEKY